MIPIKHYSKISLIVIYVLMGSHAYYERFSELGFSLNGLLFSGLLSVCILGIFLSAFIQKNMLRHIYALILFSSSALYLSYTNIMGSSLSYDAFISLIDARGFAGEAFQQYYSKIVVPVGTSVLLFVAITLRPKQLPVYIQKFSVYAPILVVFLLSSVLFLRGGYGEKGLHSPFIPLAYSGLAVYENTTKNSGERSKVTISRENKIIDHDIILIIDESISPSYLDINSDHGILSNLKDNYEHINIYNYGYAASITNCSHSANLTLRYGGTRNDYLFIIATMPSVWQYAKKAGLSTVYIDGQRTAMRLQNGMSIKEKESIDHFIQFDNSPIVSRDQLIASTLIKFINNDHNEFIIINKIGAHFPIHDKYPDEFEYYKPALPRGRFGDISDTGSREGFSGNANDWVLYRNSYRNTLLWSVGNFFKTILNNSNLNKAVIMYTSDHGQNLHEDGSTGVNTHCSSEPNMIEGMVPLAVLQGNDITTLDWQKYLTINKDSSSHYNLFPTILSLMAYQPDEIKNTYGNALHMPTNDELTFNTRFNARLGQKPKWKKIEPAMLKFPTKKHPLP